MSIYTEQHAYEYLKRIAEALENISKWVEYQYTGKPSLQVPPSVAPTAGSASASKSPAKPVAVQPVSPASQNTTVGSQSKAESVPSASANQTQKDGSL